MKELTYAEKLKSPKWQKKRLEILKRDKFTCKLCGDDETQLHIHHLEYNKGSEPWECDNKTLITLCEDCHKIAEDAKREGADFKSVKVYKSNGWEGGGKIIFCYYNEICNMSIFDSNGKKNIGFNFPDIYIRELLKYFKSLT